MDLKGKVVLITGASSGFGMDAARLFAYEGCSVVLAARRIDRLQEQAAQIQAQGGEAFAVPVDVANREEIEIMVETVLDLYGQSQDGKLRSRIIHVLGEFENPKALQKLVDVSRTDGSPELRRRALAALGETRQAEAVPVLKDAAQNAAELQLRRTALKALADFDDPSLVGFFKQMALTETKAELARLAVDGLDEMEQPGRDEALLQVLKDRRIAGAALDVFWQEPLPPEHPFWGLNNLILTPHVGGMADIYLKQAVGVFKENLRRYLRGERRDLVNFIERK